MKKIVTIEPRGTKWYIRAGREPWREVTQKDVEEIEWLKKWVKNV